MKLPKPQFGLRFLFALALLVAVACAAWRYAQPFGCLEEQMVKKTGAGNVTVTEKTYVWHSGLAVTVTQSPGKWPSVRRRTDIDVAELEQELEEGMREEAEEQARADAGQVAR